MNLQKKQNVFFYIKSLFDQCFKFCHYRKRTKKIKNKKEKEKKILSLSCNLSDGSILNLLYFKLLINLKEIKNILKHLLPTGSTYVCVSAAGKNIITQYFNLTLVTLPSLVV